MDNLISIQEMELMPMFRPCPTCKTQAHWHSLIALSKEKKYKDCYMISCNHCNTKRLVLKQEGDEFLKLIDNGLLSSCEDVEFTAPWSA